MPDSFTFGCPAPRLGLDLAQPSSALLATLSLLRFKLYICVREKLTEVQFLELLKPLRMSRTP